MLNNLKFTRKSELSKSEIKIVNSFLLSELPNNLKIIYPSQKIQSLFKLNESRSNRKHPYFRNKK